MKRDMKRDMKLIGIILNEIQNGNTNGAIKGYSEDEVKYHKMVAINDNLISGRVLPNRRTSSPIPSRVTVSGITSAGYDMIDRKTAKGGDQWYKKPLGLVALSIISITIASLFVIRLKEFIFTP